ncbi:MAG TPA: hypothetical protein VHF22_05440, partial [Planctomycetota bacterium]|nr:hypothetical protein [Planctomycetota bacterium]
MRRRLLEARAAVDRGEREAFGLHVVDAREQTLRELRVAFRSRRGPSCGGASDERGEPPRAPEGVQIAELARVVRRRAAQDGDLGEEARRCAEPIAGDARHADAHVHATRRAEHLRPADSEVRAAHRAPPPLAAFRRGFRLAEGFARASSRP